MPKINLAQVFETVEKYEKACAAETAAALDWLDEQVYNPLKDTIEDLNEQLKARVDTTFDMANVTREDDNIVVYVARWEQGYPEDGFVLEPVVRVGTTKMNFINIADWTPGTRAASNNIQAKVHGNKAVALDDGNAIVNQALDVVRRYLLRYAADYKKKA